MTTYERGEKLIKISNAVFEVIKKEVENGIMTKERFSLLMEIQTRAVLNLFDEEDNTK